MAKGGVYKAASYGQNTSMLWLYTVLVLESETDRLPATGALGKPSIGVPPHLASLPPLRLPMWWASQWKASEAAERGTLMQVSALTSAAVAITATSDASHQFVQCMGDPEWGGGDGGRSGGSWLTRPDKSALSDSQSAPKAVPSLAPYLLKTIIPMCDVCSVA